MTLLLLFKQGTGEDEEKPNIPTMAECRNKNDKVRTIRLGIGMRELQWL